MLEFPTAKFYSFMKIESWRTMGQFGREEEGVGDLQWKVRAGRCISLLIPITLVIIKSYCITRLQWKPAVKLIRAYLISLELNSNYDASPIVCSQGVGGAF